MMFGDLSTKLSNIFGTLTGKANLSANDVQEALQQVKVALIEADVALSVVKQFIEDVSKDAVGAQVVGRETLPKAATVYELVKRRLTELLGENEAPLNLDPPPPPPPPPSSPSPSSSSSSSSSLDRSFSVLLMLGVQGSGKTTTTAKLARRLTLVDKKKVLLASLDTNRPAAQEQLAILAHQCGVDCLDIIKGQNPKEIASRAMQTAQSRNYDVLILDSAGRLHVDETLMHEIVEIRDQTQPQETLLVADAMLGNDAVNISRDFHAKVGVSGIILTRLDGDARGGAAISMRQITGVPIKFVGVGEALPDLDRFVPSGFASKILGGGDINALADKARQIIDENEQRAFMSSLQSGTISLQDYHKHLGHLKKMGSVKNMLSYFPSQNSAQVESLLNQSMTQMTPKMIEQQMQILDAMNDIEKQNPDIVRSNSTRKLAISNQTGVPVLEVNRMFKGFDQFKKIAPVMSEMSKGKSELPSLKEAMDHPLMKKLMNRKKVVMKR